MDILRNLRTLESRIGKTVDEASEKLRPAAPREPLEILHAIVEAVESRIEPAGRGKYVFPFNQIRISIAADSADKRARFDAVLESEPRLQDRIVERLRTSGCDCGGLAIETNYVDVSEPHFQVEFDRVVRSVQHHMKLTMANGREHVFTGPRINLGRGGEVRDSRNRLVRMNDVAFDDDLTVSRTHAHIDEYRIYDDRSAHGTSIVRSGKTITVPPGPRGVRLESGDEIRLGEARILLEIG